MKYVCEACGRDNLVHLGTLGLLEHYRCRACGWEQVKSVDPPAEAETEFIGDHSVADLQRMMMDGACEAVCPECGDVRMVEPDACGYPCWTEGCEGRISSPLVEAGLI